MIEWITNNSVLAIVIYIVIIMVFYVLVMVFMMRDNTAYVDSETKGFAIFLAFVWPLTLIVYIISVLFNALDILSEYIVENTGEKREKFVINEDTPTETLLAKVRKIL